MVPQLDSVSLLLDHGVSVDTHMPLHLTVYSWGPGSDALVRLLVARGADLDAKDTSGTTPLLMAAGFLRARAVNTLLALGANVNAKDASGISPLRRALRGDYGQNMAVIEALVAGGADMDACGALHSAANMENLEAVEVLVRAGADLTARGPDFWMLVPTRGVRRETGPEYVPMTALEVFELKWRKYCPLEEERDAYEIVGQVGRADRWRRITELLTPRV